MRLPHFSLLHLPEFDSNTKLKYYSIPNIAPGDKDAQLPVLYRLLKSNLTIWDWPFSLNIICYILTLIINMENSRESNIESMLNVDIVKELWTKTYNSEGKPDWTHIFPFYHPEIVFKDSIQEIRGIDEFKKMCQRLTKRCSKLSVDIKFITQEDNVIFMEWIMTMVFRRLPNTSMHGCTKLTLHKDGRIIEQRDYYDLWGDIFDRVPVFHLFYRKFMKTFFG